MRNVRSPEPACARCLSKSTETPVPATRSKLLLTDIYLIHYYNISKDNNRTFIPYISLMVYRK